MAATHPAQVFASVFPPANFTTPTPEATPNIGTLSSPARSFGGFNYSNNPAQDAVAFNRSWSAATRFLSLAVGTNHTHGDGQSIRDAAAAIHFLWTSPSTRSELVSWYTNEIGVHFRQFALPSLEAWQSPISSLAATNVLDITIHNLQNAQELYLRPFFVILNNTRNVDQRDSVEIFSARMKQGVQRLFLHSLPRQRLQKTLANVMYHQMEASLKASSSRQKCSKSGECRCQLSLDNLPLVALHSVGLGGNLGERAFAHAVHKLLDGPAVERRCFEVDWSGHESVVTKLRNWVIFKFSPFIERALSALTSNVSLKLTETEINQFATMAVLKLGRQRTLALFDYVKSWPESQGAVLDIKEYLSYGTLPDKAHVCSSFSNQIQTRLLHSGASTSELLSIYINVIHAFRLLDARGVLLEKVGSQIRNYLRARDDTVSIIAASFLADVDEKGNVSHHDSDKVCPDITIEVARSSLEDHQDNRMLNWNDMEWAPDPIDAGPQYRASKSEDVVAYILGLFEQEDFIKEVTNVLAQHLLHMIDSEYVKETRLVELFKSRLDPTKLQAAEVMLKDVRDSAAMNRKINTKNTPTDTGATPTPREIQTAIPEDGITMHSLYQKFEHRMKQAEFLATIKLVAMRRQDLLYPKRTRLPPEPSNSAGESGLPLDFKVQVLSSFFWPEMQAREYQMPAGFSPMQDIFVDYFRRQGGQRKLQYKPALARCTVELELEDRQIKEVDIPAWRGSVIDAFASERDDAVQNDHPATYDPSAGLSAEQLMEMLSMEEDLVTDALHFWTGKRVLYQRTPGVYAVLERLDMDTGMQDAEDDDEHANAISGVKTQDAIFQEGAPTFSTFILNMLRNGGAKEVEGMMGITNMLKMVLPTFTYGEEEVRYLLSEMESKGEVVRNGDSWSTK